MSSEPNPAAETFQSFVAAINRHDVAALSALVTAGTDAVLSSVADVGRQTERFKTSTIYTGDSMRRRLLQLPLFLLIGVSALAQSSVPLRAATYMLEGTSCSNPANAAILPFNGRDFGSGKAVTCRSTILSHKGSIYVVSTLCGAAHREVITVDRASATRFAITSKSDVPLSGGPMRYRWCYSGSPR